MNKPKVVLTEKRIIAASTTRCLLPGTRSRKPKTGNLCYAAKANNYIQGSDTFWKKTVYKLEHERHIAELQNNLRKS